MADEAVTPSAQALLTCLQAEMLANPNPPQHFQLRVGSDPVAADVDEHTDYCCQGIVYVRVGRVFPAGEQWPIADEQAMPCMPAAWGVDLEMGAFRCVPFGMDAQAWQDAFVNIQNDRAAMAEAICCWLADQRLNNERFMNYMVRDWEPFVNQGGCSGGAMRVQMQFGSCESCE